uniref:Uncharacterized protein n=1 Tax=Mola mola TaxID=94237 RepID=A0A3Q3X2S9_MOLML
MSDKKFLTLCDTFAPLEHSYTCNKFKCHIHSMKYKPPQLFWNVLWALNSKSVYLQKTVWLHFAGPMKHVVSPFFLCSPATRRGTCVTSLQRSRSAC